MRNALPNAAFIGFTGTPLMAGEEKTREVFGDYVSIYNFKQSVDDQRHRAALLREPHPRAATDQRDLNEDMAARAGRRRAGRGAGGEAGARVRPRVPPDHPRRPAGEDRRGHRRALHGPRLRGQGDGGLRSTRPPPCGCTTRCRQHWKTHLADAANAELATCDPMERPDLRSADRVHADDRHGGGRLPGPERDRGHGQRRGWTSARTGSAWSRRTWTPSSRTRTIRSASSSSAPCG